MERRKNISCPYCMDKSGVCDLEPTQPCVRRPHPHELIKIVDYSVCNGCEHVKTCPYCEGNWYLE